jgi:hypothetical protein
MFQQRRIQDGPHSAGVSVGSGSGQPFCAGYLHLGNGSAAVLCCKSVQAFPCSCSPCPLSRARGPRYLLLAHSEACEQGVRREGAQTAFATISLAVRPHLCTHPPPTGASTHQAQLHVYYPHNSYRWLDHLPLVLCYPQLMFDDYSMSDVYFMPRLQFLILSLQNDGQKKSTTYV